MAEQDPISEAARRVRDLKGGVPIILRMGVATAVTVEAHPKVTATVDGTSYSGIAKMDHVTISVGNNVWIADMGAGRWIIIGTSGN